MSLGHLSIRGTALAVVLVLTAGAGSAAADGTITSQLTPTAPFARAAAPSTRSSSSSTRVLPAGGPRQLPFTGDDLWPESLAATGLIGAGLWLRRTRRDPSARTGVGSSTR